MFFVCIIFVLFTYMLAMLFGLTSPWLALPNQSAIYLNAHMESVVWFWCVCLCCFEWKSILRFIPVLWNKRNQIQLKNSFTCSTLRPALSLISVATETYEATLVNPNLRCLMSYFQTFAWSCGDMVFISSMGLCSCKKDVRPQKETPWLVLSLKFNSTCYSHPSVMRGLCSKEGFRLGKLIYGAPALAYSL